MLNHPVTLPLQIRIAQWLFYLNTLIWLGLGAASMLQPSRAGGISPATLLVIAALMFANSAAMLLSGWGIVRRNFSLYVFALAVLAVNILLTFSDQFGAIDLLTLLVDVVLFGLLLVNRRYYRPARSMSG